MYLPQKLSGDSGGSSLQGPKDEDAPVDHIRHLRWSSDPPWSRRDINVKSQLMKHPMGGFFGNLC